MNEEKDILKKHIVSDFKKEVPSANFTEKVMQKVEHSLETKTVVAPLISKKTWLISGIIAVMIILGSFGIEVQKIEVDWFNNFNLPDIQQFKTTLNLGLIIISIFAIMTLTDFIYRRKNHLTS